jgi:hypothetical protein
VKASSLPQATNIGVAPTSGDSASVPYFVKSLASSKAPGALDLNDENSAGLAAAAAAVDRRERERRGAAADRVRKKVVKLEVGERAGVVAASAVKHDRDAGGRDRRGDRPPHRPISFGRREAAALDSRSAWRGSGVDVALAGEPSEPDAAWQDVFFDADVASGERDHDGPGRAQHECAPRGHGRPLAHLAGCPC